MKKKKFLVILLIIIGMMVLVGIILFRNEDKNYILSLKDFKDGEVFQFSEIPWKASKEEAEDIIGLSLLEDPHRTPAPEGIQFYISDKEYLLNGVRTNPSFEFHDDKLWIVQFYFDIEENSQEWFESIVEELKGLYGVETDKFENPNANISSRGYKWNASNTSLQIISMTGDNTHPQIVISVGILDP